MKINGIDSNLYNGDKIYKLLKKYKVAYKNLNKETILNLILSVDKGGKNQNDFLLKNKRFKNDDEDDDKEINGDNFENFEDYFKNPTSVSVVKANKISDYKE